MGERLPKSEAERMIDEQVAMHGSTTLRQGSLWNTIKYIIYNFLTVKVMIPDYSEILIKNNITTRRKTAAVFYAILEKAKAEEIRPIQVTWSHRIRMIL